MDKSANALALPGRETAFEKGDQAMAQYAGPATEGAQPPRHRALAAAGHWLAHFVQTMLAMCAAMMLHTMCERRRRDRAVGKRGDHAC